MVEKVPPAIASEEDGPHLFEGNANEDLPPTENNIEDENGLISDNLASSVTANVIVSVVATNVSSKESHLPVVDEIEKAQSSTNQPPTPSLNSVENKDLDIRNAMHSFYSKYNPEKVNTIDNILQQYLGFEIQLVQHLIQKYNAVEKSDLEIFEASLEPKQLQHLAEYQIHLKKEASGSGDVTVENSKEENKEDPTTPETPTKSKSLESLKGVIGTAKQSLMTSNISDISNNIAGRLLNGWNSATSSSSPNVPTTRNGHTHSVLPGSNSNENLNGNTASVPISSSTASVADELLLMTRINSMQAEITSLEAAKSHLTGNIRVLKSQVLTASQWVDRFFICSLFHLIFCLWFSSSFFVITHTSS